MISNMLRQLANSSMPFTLLGCSLPISSIIQCTLKSPNFLETFSLKTLISMMFTIALTSMSVPSEPTFAIFSTQPVSLSFSIIRNSRLKVSETTRLFLEGSSLSSLLNELRIEILYFYKKLHKFVVTLQWSEFDTADNSCKITLDEIVINIFNSLINKTFALGKFSCFL